METNAVHEPQQKAEPVERRSAPHLPSWAISLAILVIAVAIFLLVYGNWNEWESGRRVQKTDDAYVHADATALSTKASGLLARMEVAEYQHVKAGQAIASLRDDDYKAQLDGAQAALHATQAGIDQLRRQEEVADSKITQAEAGVAAAESQVAAAQAGITAANATIRDAEAALNGVHAQFQNASEEIERQQGLFAAKATTLQKLQNQQAQTAAARALLDTRESDVKAAQAQLEARTADLKRAQSGLASSRADVAAAISSRRLLTAKEQELRAEINARQASVESAKVALGYTTIVAPSNGYIASRNVLPGQMVSPGTTVVSLVQEEPWIIANFKETQLTHIRPGDPAEIKVDAFPSRSWKGHVLFIAPQSGAQTALIPPDNASGNFTKIVQRIPVKITIDQGQDDESLRPGMSATIAVTTNREK
jgi:membrane fusion protein (multidrug efflux system)